MARFSWNMILLAVAAALLDSVTVVGLSTDAIVVPAGMAPCLSVSVIELPWSAGVKLAAAEVKVAEPLVAEPSENVCVVTQSLPLSPEAAKTAWPWAAIMANSLCSVVVITLCP